MANYNFQSGSSYLLQQIAFNSAKSLAKSGVFTLNDIVSRVVNRDKSKNEPVYDFDNFYPSDGYIKSSKLSKDSIVSISFNKSVVYFDETGQHFTPKLDIHLCEINVKRNFEIIQTSVPNENGSIQERYYGGSDYDITVEGLLIGNFGVINNLEPLNLRPEKDILNFVEICNSGVPIPITCPYLNDYFGITNIQIVDFEMPFESEMKNMQRFMFNAISSNEKLKLGV